MADEQLRMQAEVVDKFSKPLRDLQKALKDIKQPPAAREMREQFAHVSKEAGAAAQAIRAGFGAAMTGLGVSSLTAAGAIAAVVAAVRGMATATTELKAFSRETGLSTQRLRELESLGGRFNVAPESVKSGIQSFSNQLYDIRRRYGETYGWLRTTAPQFAEQLVGSKSVEEAVGRALGYLAKIRDPHERQVFAEKLFGSGDFGRFGAEGFAKLQEQLADVRKALGELPKGADEAAEQFERSLKSLGDTLQGIRDLVGAGALPTLNEQLEALHVEMAKPEFKEGVKEFTGDLVEGLKIAIQLVKDLKDSMTWFYERTFNPVKKLSPEEFSKAQQDFYKPQIEEARRKLQEFDAETGSRRGSLTEKQLEARDRRRQFLDDDIRRLEKAMKDGIRDGLKESAPMIQQQSFDGAGIGGGGARIWNASFGGGGGGGFSMPRLRGPGGGIGIDWDDKSRPPGTGTGSDVKQMVDAAASKHGIDPRILYGIIAGESAHGNRYDVGDGGRSFSMWQMYLGGGLGNVFERQTGLSVKDPKNIRAITDWVARYIARTHDLKPWHGFHGKRDWNSRWGNMGYSPPASAHDDELSRRSDSLMRKRSGDQTVRGDARVQIDLNGFPKGTRFNTQANGMFKDIRLNRGRQMPDSGTDV